MTTYTLQDLMYAKGTSEPVRQALQAQAAEIERLRLALDSVAIMSEEASVALYARRAVREERNADR